MMSASLLLRQRPQVVKVGNLLRQSNIQTNKFSSEADDSGENRKLTGLLSSLGNKNVNEPKLSQPKGGMKLKKGIKPEKIRNDEELDEDVVNAAKIVANTSAAPETTESDLLKKLKEISQIAKTAKSENEVTGEKPNLANLFGNMKVEKKPESSVQRVVAAQQYKQEKQKNLSLEQKAFLDKRAKLRIQKASKNLEETYVPTDLFGAEPLNIFTEFTPTEASEKTESTEAKAPVLRTWRACAERELTLLSTPPPRNALEEQIEWTLQGKIWQFPIDNEQGLDYSHEKFHEHLFLDGHIRSWCPPSGPVRHFMELVCVGLSKNPYVSVQYKKDTLEWFRNYFHSAEINEILVHKGAWQEQPTATK